MVNYLLSIRYGLVHFVNDIFWIWLEYSVLFILSVAIFVILLILFVIYLKYLKRKVVALRESLIYKYDDIFYLLALADYEEMLSNNTLWDSSSFSVMKTIINTGKYTYISNYSLIKKSVKEFEVFLWKEVISENLWSYIDIMYKKMKSKILISKLFKILLALLILWFVAIFVYIFYIKL